MKKICQKTHTLLPHPCIIQTKGHFLSYYVYSDWRSLTKHGGVSVCVCLCMCVCVRVFVCVCLCVFLCRLCVCVPFVCVIVRIPYVRATISTLLVSFNTLSFCRVFHLVSDLPSINIFHSTPSSSISAPPPPTPAPSVA